jgi:7-cyano-7-deazaguanine reductase
MMNTPTPPSRKVAKPKARRSTSAQPSAEKSAGAAPASSEPTVAVESAKPEAPKHDAPTFIEGDAPAHEHRHQKKRRNNKWRNKAPQQEAAAPEATPAAQEDEMGPQTRHLTLLGNKTVYSDRYTPAILEAFDNRHPENDYFVKFNCPEFTSLCPITGQPDFATIYISYIPDRKMVESKSLKLYLFGFRNHGAFHEDCVNIIMKDLIKLMSPRYIEVWGKFLPRGGLSIDPYVNYGRPTTKWEEFARQRLLMHDLSPETINNR